MLSSNSAFSFFLRESSGDWSPPEQHCAEQLLPAGVTDTIEGSQKWHSLIIYSPYRCDHPALKKQLLGWYTPPEKVLEGDEIV